MPSPKNDVGHDTGHPKSAYRWDFAIAVRPGWHVTIFPLGLLLIGVAALLVAAGIVAALWAF
jgi:hypothetical protein